MPKPLMQHSIRCFLLVSMLLVPGVARAAAFALQQVSPGDYVHFGVVALTTAENQGGIANLGVIIGRDAVAVIDTGGSVAEGQAFRQAIGTLTGKPIRYVINTHEHPDHVFGNAAFAAPGVTFVGHHNLPRELAERGAYYKRSFRDALGPAAIAQVKIIAPTLLVQGRMELDLGGRKLELIAWSPAAHTDCDLTVLDETTGTLFAGDLVFLQHVPVVDGSVAGFLTVIGKLERVKAARVVPGHGRLVAPWPQALDDERRYLTTLAADAKRLVVAGVPMQKAVPRIGISEHDRWTLFGAYNPRNATLAFSEAEWQ